MRSPQPQAHDLSLTWGRCCGQRGKRAGESPSGRCDLAQRGPPQQRDREPGRALHTQRGSEPPPFKPAEDTAKRTHATFALSPPPNILALK